MTVLTKPPSNLKYSAIPPEPSSDWNLISPSVAMYCCMIKSPVPC